MNPVKAGDSPSLVWTLFLGFSIISWQAGLRVISKYTTFKWTESEKTWLQELVQFCSSLSVNWTIFTIMRDQQSWAKGQSTQSTHSTYVSCPPGHTQVTLGHVIVPIHGVRLPPSTLAIAWLWGWMSIRSRTILSLEAVSPAPALQIGNAKWVVSGTEVRWINRTEL